MKLRDKLKVFLKEKYRLIAVVFAALVGIVLIALSFGGGNDGEEKNNTVPLAEYKATLEGELEEACSSVRGVGRCEVIVTFERGAENTYKGNSLIESKPPRVMGVTVICDGADSDEVRACITGMMSSLFAIGTNRISVMKLNK